MRTGRTAAGAVVGLALLTGCGSADPVAVAAIGLDRSGQLAVVRMCDEGRSLTHVELVAVDDDRVTLGWIGRTVEPITVFRIAGDPPDNWVIDVEGGLLDDVTYRMDARASDLQIPGPEFTLEQIRELGSDEVIDAAGLVRDKDEFLENACDDATP